MTLSSRKGRRFRRARRRGRLCPAKATAISQRARYWRKHDKWLQTKGITRHHRYRKYWEGWSE